MKQLFQKKAIQSFWNLKYLQKVTSSTVIFRILNYYRRWRNFISLRFFQKSIFPYKIIFRLSGE